jgi:hypothetical protein
MEWIKSLRSMILATLLTFTYGSLYAQVLPYQGKTITVM